MRSGGGFGGSTVPGVRWRLDRTSRRPRMRLIAALLFVLLMPTVVVAQPAGTPPVRLVAEPVALDPAQATDLTSNRVGRRGAETLGAFAAGSAQIVPGLAESWRISAARL